MLAGSVLLSRVLGWARDLVLANQVGAGAEADAYYAAFQIPDIMNYLLAGGALSIAFLPFYTRVRDQRGAAEADRLFSTVLGTMTLLTVLATCVLWWQADALVALQFPRFSPETRALTAQLTRIVLPGQAFFVSGGILAAVLMAEGRFGSQALAPLAYNACIIAGGLLTGTVEGFAWGVLAGAITGPFVVRYLDLSRTRTIRWRVAPGNRDFLTYLWMALPLMLGLSLVTVDEWYDRWFGAVLGEGVVAMLSFARKLMQAPVAVIGQAIATAALPTLSHLFTSGRVQELERTLLRTLQGAGALAVLAAAATWAFAAPGVELAYHHGRFSAEAAERTADILAVLAFGIPAWIVQQVAVRAFYARGDTWRPMWLGTGLALLAIPVYVAMGQRFGPEGLAAAGALAMSVSALVTLGWARRLHGAPALPAFFGSLARMAVVAGGAAGAARLAMAGLEGGGKPGAVADLFFGGLAFAAVAAAGIRWLGDEPVRELAGGLVRRVRGRIARRR
ncbi:MAG: murein biosynthesis integral membrane protein MurJ [Myxococcota bacterium]